MEEEIKPSTDNQELELGSGLGEDVSKAEDLEAEPTSETVDYKKLTGRDDIKTEKDFKKHYEGLKSLVGDQRLAELRTKAEKYDKLQVDIRKETDEFLVTEEGKEVAKGFAEEAIEGRVGNLENELKIERFLKTYPEAQSIVNLVRAKSDINEISLEKAYAESLANEKYSLKDLLSSKLEADKAKGEEKSSLVESKSRIASGMTAEVNKLVEEVQKTDSLDAKQKLVEKILELSK